VLLGTFIGGDTMHRNLKSFRSFLTEAVGKMGPSEWIKINSKSGEPRMEILKKAIESGTPLEYNAGKLGQGQIVIDKSNLSAIRDIIKNFESTGKISAFPITGTDVATGANLDILSSHLLKTELFGGGGSGSGGGAASTDLTESAQCYYCALVSHVYGRELQLDEVVSKDKFKKAARAVDATSSIEEIIGNLDPEWEQSSRKIANILLRAGYISTSAKNTIYRGKGVMKEVYDAMKVAAKNSGVKPLKDDKWNPGDIWIQSGSGNIKFDTSSIQAFNGQILDLFKSKELIAVSLKKIAKNAEPVITEYNTDNSSHMDVKMNSYSVASSGKSFFESGKDVYIIHTEGKSQARTFNDMSNFSMEHKLKAAAGGKAGHSAINDIASMQKSKKTLMDYKQLKRMVVTNSDKFKKEFMDLIEKYYDKKMSKKEIIAGIDEKHAEKKYDWLFSKFLGLQLIDMITSDRSNKILTQAVNYAFSASELSSAFIKVS
jgi:hypothetical protein